MSASSPERSNSGIRPLTAAAVCLVGGLGFSLWGDHGAAARADAVQNCLSKQPGATVITFQVRDCLDDLGMQYGETRNKFKAGETTDGLIGYEAELADDASHLTVGEVALDAGLLAMAGVILAGVPARR